MAVRALNQLIGRVGLFIIDCALQPQRACAAGGGVPGVLAAGSLGTGRGPSAGAAEYRRGGGAW